MIIREINKSVKIFYGLNFFVARENGSIEKHIGALVALLESCLRHDLKPTAKDEDPPHAKIASDVMSCIFPVRPYAYIHAHLMPTVCIDLKQFVGVIIYISLRFCLCHDVTV